MGEVPADAPPFREGIESGPCRADVLIAEFDRVMHEIADRLHQGTTLGMIAELSPGVIRQAVGLAIPAAEQIDEHLTGRLSSE